MPVVRKSIRRKASRETPEGRNGNPSWERGKEPTYAGKNRVSDVAVFHGIAPGPMPPRKRLPITRSAPARSALTNASRLLKS